MKKALAVPCEYCEGVVQERRVRDDYWSGDSLVIIENVPVGVCSKCGERYYSAAVLERMDRIAARRSKIKRTLRVPVTTFDTTA
jgi:YgiT-type zinc finger domain-containing protein